MMEAKFLDGHTEHTGPSPLADIFKDATKALERGAIYAKIYPIHTFVGDDRRCKTCRKIAADGIHATQSAAPRG